MTSTNPQCGRTYVHGPHETTEGRCPGLPLLDPPLGPPLVIRMPRRKHGDPEVLNPEVLGGRGLLVIPHDATWEPIEQPMLSTFADAEPDPLRSWCLAYPGPSATSTLDPGSGPGWGDDSDVENARCCPWCRGSLTDHNREVHAAGYSLGERHSIEDLQRLATDTVMNASRDPWASDGAGYDVRVLRAGIQAIASDALVREDFGTAAYAYSVLAGDPIRPTYNDESSGCTCADYDYSPDGSHASWCPLSESPAEDRASRIYVGSHIGIRIDSDKVPPEGFLVLPGDPPDEGDLTAAGAVRSEPCGAAAYGVRFAACDQPASHEGQHHAWYDAGHSPTTVLWDN